MEFKEYKLSDLTINGKGEYGIGASAVEYNPSLYRYLRITDIDDNGFINTDELKSVNDKNAENYLLKENEIVFARTGNSTGKSYFYNGEDGPLVFAGFLIRFKLDSKKVNPKFIRYYTLSENYKGWINQFATGSTRKNINAKTYGNMIIKLPPRSYQNYIVQILDSLEEKLKENKKIIANLEELSQTLFKRWFVDFEFPDENGNPYKSSGGEMIDSELGNIPRDWEVNELGNYVDIIKGLSYKGAFLDKQHERSDSFPLLSISNFNFISGFKSNKTKYYFGDYKERHLVNPGDILIAATDLTQDRKILGAPAIIPNLNKTMIFSLDVFKITETTIPKYVLYFLLQSAKYREFVEGSATGTTVIRIAKNVILKVPIVIDKDISLKFDDLIKPYMEKIEHLSQENQKLTQLRDALLPKLMSGEIEIPDDIEVNEDELSI